MKENSMLRRLFCNSEMFQWLLVVSLALSCHSVHSRTANEWKSRVIYQVNKYFTRDLCKITFANLAVDG